MSPPEWLVAPTVAGVLAAARGDGTVDGGAPGPDAGPVAAVAELDAKVDRLDVSLARVNTEMEAIGQKMWRGRRTMATPTRAGLESAKTASRPNLVLKPP